MRTQIYMVQLLSGKKVLLTKERDYKVTLTKPKLQIHSKELSISLKTLYKVPENIKNLF